MNRMTRIGLSLAVAALVLTAGWGVALRGANAGAAPTVAVDSATMAVGATGSVDVTALNMPDPGLGAWSINVTYDPSVLEADGCTAQNGSVCNPAFAADTVRISGATAQGMPGDTVLSIIGFRCVLVGSSPLTLTIDTLADGTPGDPQDIDADIVNGSVNCAVPSTPTTPPPVPTATPGGGNGTGGNGFPAAGGTYKGEVPGEGWVIIVIEPNGQGIKSITIQNLVTVCGTINQQLHFDPPLDIQEPGFSYSLFAFSEGGAVLSIEGFFAEDGTIPVDLIIDTANEDFPADASPCLSENQVIPLVLRRQSDSTAPPPPPPGGGSYHPPSGGSYLPDAGYGPGLGIDAENPVTWLIAAMIGAGVAWLSAGFAGAGLATVAGSAISEVKPSRKARGFMPSMQPVSHADRPETRVDRSVRLPKRETVVEPPQLKRRASSVDSSSFGSFRAPRRPDRR
jgi:hypothetical protein